MTQLLPLALTMGDPAGVGPEITLKAWLKRTDNTHPFFTVADADHLVATAQSLGFQVPVEKISAPHQAGAIFNTALPVLHQALNEKPIYGKPSPANADQILGSIEACVEFSQKGLASAVVTNPIAKDVLYAAGFQFPGHTEFLAHLSGPNVHPVMMLACPKLRVVLATVHLSIFDAVKSLSTDTIVEVARITHQALKRDFAIAEPILGVAGLNPHAGEGGSMGREEIDTIGPAIERLRADGINAIGPFPPDAMFTAKALPTYDVAVCMYHDQGLIPLKALDFERGVNATLGLPFVRTSPDHGTAFDIAGTGKASELSLMAALSMAVEMSQARAKA